MYINHQFNNPWQYCTDSVKLQRLIEVQAKPKQSLKHSVWSILQWRTSSSDAEYFNASSKNFSKISDT
jgi:hypothetical protein